MTTTVEAVNTLKNDVDIVHQLVHSTADTVLTENGPLRTFFKLEKDLSDQVQGLLPNFDLKADKAELSSARSGKDANGIYTTTEYRRHDGTLAKTSVLSDGTTPTYTTRTVTFYQTDGATVVLTQVFTLTYSGNELVSEVLQ